MILKQSLEGKVAIVTGGGSGIGRSVAEVLAEHQAKVVITSRTKIQLDKTANSLRIKVVLFLLFLQM